MEKIKEKARDNLEFHGIDIALPYLKKAYSKGINVAMSKIEEIPYKNEYFDLITCTDVLEHVVDLNRCIQSILDVLKPGGILVVRVPNREELSNYLQPDYPYQLAHVRGFDEYSLELLFTRIFKLEFIEKTPGLFMENYPLLKYKMPFRGYNFLVRMHLKVLKKISKKIYGWALVKLFHPTEINAVIRKPMI